MGTWRFAINQFDVVLDGNKNISNFYTGFIDMFGWGTSGWHDTTDTGNIYYYPYSTNYDYVHGYGPSRSMKDTNLTGTSSWYDWGVFNAISNGGEKPGLWRTLSKEEWDYLLKKRTGATNKIGVAMICGIAGIVLLPDNWVLPSQLSFTSGFGKNAAYTAFSKNEYSFEQWSIMEKAGAVFLPATTKWSNNVEPDLGHYWTCTAAHYNCQSIIIYFDGKQISVGDMLSPNTTGYDNPVENRVAVRLVQDVKE